MFERLQLFFIFISKLFPYSESDCILWCGILHPPVTTEFISTLTLTTFIPIIQKRLDFFLMNDVLLRFPYQERLFI
jgi:hypothetical protein